MKFRKWRAETGVDDGGECCLVPLPEVLNDGLEVIVESGGECVIVLRRIPDVRAIRLVLSRLYAFDERPWNIEVGNEPLEGCVGAERDSQEILEATVTGPGDENARLVRNSVVIHL